MNEESLRAQVLACAAMCAVLLKTHPNRDVAQDQSAKMLGRLIGLLMPGASPQATEAAATVVVHTFAAAADGPLSTGA
jgi:hypothetical protein